MQNTCISQTVSSASGAEPTSKAKESDHIFVEESRAGAHTVERQRRYRRVGGGSSKFASFSTLRRRTEGLTFNAAQISKMLRRDGLVFPNSIKLMNARS